MCHDYAHCANRTCPKSSTCFRAYLAREDVRIKKKNPDAFLWCSYAGFSPDENGECKDYGDIAEWGLSPELEEECETPVEKQ